MKIIDPQDYSSVLHQWHNAEAKVWIFHVTHRRMALALFRKGEQGAVYIIATGCEHVVGPFAWRSARVVINDIGSDGWGDEHYRVIDKEAGFDLLCSSVAMVRGLAAVPADPFDGFISDPD